MNEELYNSPRHICTKTKVITITEQEFTILVTRNQRKVDGFRIILIKITKYNYNANTIP